MAGLASARLIRVISTSHSLLIAVLSSARPSGPLLPEPSAGTQPLTVNSDKSGTSREWQRLGL